jgi:hypothetical protein
MFQILWLYKDASKVNQMGDKGMGNSNINNEYLLKYNTYLGEKKRNENILLG